MEVDLNEVWGTVCDDLWDLNNAQVVCTELGFYKAVAADHWAFYGQGSEQIWLDNLLHVGTEVTIENCTHKRWGSHYYPHYEDASANCTARM